MDDHETQVVVIGAGYAGMMAALRLAGKAGNLAQVTLVNALDVFIQRPQLLQFAVDRLDPTRPISQMLRGSRVHFEQGWVSRLEPKRRTITVETSSGSQELHYDYVVYALGSFNDQASIPGVRDYTYVLNPYGTHSAKELHERLVELSQGAGRVVVVGGGATGIEAAAEVKGQYPGIQVDLVTEGEFGAFRGERVKGHIRQAFLQQGIPFHEFKTVTAVEDGRIVLAADEVIPFDVCVWAGGFRPLPLAREAGLAVNPRDQILVDPYGRSISHPDIYAAGDASQPIQEPGVPVRMSLFTALTEGAHVADNLCATLEGKPQKPLRFAYYGQGVTLGPQDAVGFLTYPDDQPHGPIFRGRLAVRIRNFAVWLVGTLLETERRWPGFYFWLGQGPYAAAKRAESQRTASSLPAQLDH